MKAAQTQFARFGATLARIGGAQYAGCVAETTATGFDSPTYRSAQPRRAAFLCVSPVRASFNGRALVGESSDSPGSSVTGLSTLPCARPPRLTVGSGLTANRRGRTMRQVPARPEQTQSPIEIIRAALRAAALAPSDAAALDATGEALRRLAELSRGEVRHG